MNNNETNGLWPIKCSFQACFYKMLHMACFQLCICQFNGYI